jgi:hypothetical protein
MVGWRLADNDQILPLMGSKGGPRNYIVSQQINVGVAMLYRAGRVIGEFGTVKRNRGPNVCLARRSSDRAYNLRHTTGRPYALKHRCKCAFRQTRP